MADVTECNVVRRTAESLNKESLFSVNFVLAPPSYFFDPTPRFMAGFMFYS